MLISLAWLKEIVAVDRGAADIARALTARGLTVDAVTRSGDDTVFDIDVPANRPDALGHRGVAREIAAAFSLTLAPVAGVPPVRGTLDPKRLRVAIEDPDLCGRYTAGLVAGVAVGPSPDPVVRRLEACGLRSINNVVDISNLVLLELGQPVHFFDLDTLEGPAIVVRRARAGETITTLDGVARALGPDYLVIADARRPVALAGVMGGADTEIRDRTRRVLIEAAWFSPAAVRRTSRDLGLVTDASQRFSRGCDPEAPWTAQALSAHLLARLASGTPESPVADLYPGAPAPARLTVSLRRAETLLGFRPSQEEAVAALAAVGLAPEPRDGTIAVTVPSWRVDLTREADLVEEIGRHLGYDRVPARRPPTASFEAVSPALPIEERSRDRLAALGFHEAVSYAMIAPGEDAPFVPGGTLAPLALANPISEAMSVLRRSLAPALARAAASNLRYGTADVRLFEVGRVFRPRGIGGAPEERLMAGFAWAGSAQPPHWSAPARAVDAYDAAGLVCDLLGPGPVLPRPRAVRASRARPGARLRMAPFGRNDGRVVRPSPPGGRRASGRARGDPPRRDRPRRDREAPPAGEAVRRDRTPSRGHAGSVDRADRRGGRGRGRPPSRGARSARSRVLQLDRSILRSPASSGRDCDDPACYPPASRADAHGRRSGAVPGAPDRRARADRRRPASPD